MRAEVENLPLGSNCKIPNFRPKRIPNRPNLEKRRSKSEKKNLKKHYKMPVKRKKKKFQILTTHKIFWRLKMETSVLPLQHPLRPRELLLRIRTGTQARTRTRIRPITEKQGQRQERGEGQCE